MRKSSISQDHQQRRAAILGDLQAGMDRDAEIARRHGVSREYVRQLRTRLGLPTYWKRTGRPRAIALQRMRKERQLALRQRPCQYPGCKRTMDSANRQTKYCLTHRTLIGVTRFGVVGQRVVSKEALAKFRANQHRYYQAHREDILASHKAWVEKNRAHLNAYRREQYYANIERERARQREYYLRHRKALNQRRRERAASQ
jgi:hypothetical protein